MAIDWPFLVRRFTEDTGPRAVTEPGTESIRLHPVDLDG